MPYTMVPVPAEHEDEVSQFVLRLTLSAALNRWDEAAMASLFERCDDRARSVIVTIARGNLNGRRISDRAAGEALGLPPGDVAEVAMEVNAECTANGWPALILMSTNLEELPEGGQGMVRTLVLAGEPARLALATNESQGG